jgi:hypothetical protein
VTIALLEPGGRFYAGGTGEEAQTHFRYAQELLEEQLRIDTAMHGAWVNSRCIERNWELLTGDETYRTSDDFRTAQHNSEYRQALVCALTGDLEQTIQSLKLALDSV